MIVIDANVIAYWTIRSEFSLMAEKALEKDSDWTAPCLWRFEFHNILAGYLRRRDLSFYESIQAVELAESQLQGNHRQAKSERVLDFVIHSSCSAYDCEYVALADELEIPLVTADREICRAFPKIAISLVEFSGTSKKK